MAADVLGKTIIMIKGDSACFSVDPHYQDGTAYEPQEGDVIRFAMKKHYTDETPLLLLNIPTDTMLLEIDPQDTENLEAGKINGRYKYDIELTRANGWVDTFISRANFILLEEVH